LIVFTKCYIIRQIRIYTIKVFQMNNALRLSRIVFFLCLLLCIGSIMGCKKEVDSDSKSRAAVKDSLTVISSGFVFDNRQPFLQCHASSVVRTADGNFLVAWFGGTHEKHDDVGIWLSKGNPGKWTKPVEIAKLREDPHWNPVLFQSPDGKIILYFKVGKTIDNWETWYKLSLDNGETWTEAKELVMGDTGGRGPVRNKPIILSDGTWLAPASNERKGVWNAFVDRSEDQGKTWSLSSFFTVNRDSVPGEGIIQPALWESSAGNVHALLRSSAGVICRSDSKDYGKTWSAVYKTDLPNPNSGIDLTKLDDGTLVLAYNRDGKNWGARNPIALAISNDNGQTWPVTIDLETGKEGDEFSYPSIIHFGETIALTYTWKRERIAFWMADVH
jgi:predicted neuraminidase